MRLLLLDAHRSTQQVLKDMFSKDDTVIVASRAADALELANEQSPDIVVMEVSLPHHSGLEFLYEFRTYTDWLSIPVIIYTSVRLDNEILQSRAWQKLNIQEYCYKPDTSIATLRMLIEKHSIAAKQTHESTA